MKKKILSIACVAAAAVFVTVLFVLEGKNAKPKEPSVDPGEGPSEVSVPEEPGVQVEPVTGPDSPEPKEPGEEPTETPEAGPKVLLADSREVLRELREISVPVAPDPVETVKPMEEEPVFDVGGEILNNELEEKKEELRKQEEEEKDREHPVEVLSSESVIPEEELPVKVLSETLSGGPVYVDPARGGPNPFESDATTKVEEHPVEEYIGSGERPGEGIHF